MSSTLFFRRGRESSGTRLPSLPIAIGIAFFAIYILAAYMGQTMLIGVMGLSVLACIAVVCVRLPVACCVFWLIVVGSTPEMWLGDIMPGQANLITALVKASGFALTAICILRYGLLVDLFNPGWAFVLMFFTAWSHGLHPNLTTGDSLRTVIGSATPYAFSFSRLSRRWCASIIETTIWVPTAALVFGLVLAAAGVRPLFAPDESGSIRLAGSTHPAFLAGLAMMAVYAALVELYRTGRGRYSALLGYNFLILVGTGSRSPLFCAVMVTGISFVALKSESFSLRKRVVPLLVCLFALPALLILAVTSSSLRLLTVLSNHAQGLSGRDLIWPYFESAWDRSPMLGWGVGAAKVLVDPDSLTAKLLGTTAAHNEFLRIGVDGGYVGIGLVILFMTLWTWRWSRLLASTDKVITRLIMVGVGIECITDNMLIAAPASVLFMWMSAVFARGRLASEAARGSEPGAEAAPA
nr:O-antigen ligase family protein [uncultured Lichenicoccus sp.]